MLIVLTLDVKISAGIDNSFYSVLCRTPVFPRLSSVGFKTQCVSFTHSLPIFSPCYLWSWVTSGNTMEGYKITLGNNFVRWLDDDTW